MKIARAIQLYYSADLRQAGNIILFGKKFLIAITPSYQKQLKIRIRGNIDSIDEDLPTDLKWHKMLCICMEKMEKPLSKLTFYAMDFSHRITFVTF